MHISDGHILGVELDMFAYEASYKEIAMVIIGLVTNSYISALRCGYLL